MLLKFSDFIQGRILEVNDFENRSKIYTPPKDIKRSDFIKTVKASNVGYCQNCSSSMENEYSSSKSYKEFSGTIDIDVCRHCGWWIIMRSHTEEYGAGYENTVSLHYSIIKKYKTDYSDATFMAINTELMKDSEKVRKMHHTTFEKFSGDVLRAHYNCKVIHVGKSHDDGADLFLIDNDKKIVVQVKRRIKEGKVEGVRLVREFVGTMMDFQTKHGMIISTAENFSQKSINKVDDFIDKKVVESIQLMNKDEFFEILSLLNVKKEKLWQPVLNSIWPQRDFDDDY